MRANLTARVALLRRAGLRRQEPGREIGLPAASRSAGSGAQLVKTSIDFPCRIGGEPLVDFIRHVLHLRAQYIVVALPR